MSNGVANARAKTLFADPRFSGFVPDHRRWDPLKGPGPSLAIIHQTAGKGCAPSLSFEL